MSVAKKLLLVSSIALASSSAFAMQSMDDESLSAATGQDGITLGITMPADPFTVILHDTNGFTGTTAAGGIKIEGIDMNSAAFTVEIDAGSSGASATDATLQIKAYYAAAINMDLGTLKVGNSNRDNSGGWGVTAASEKTVANLGSITIGASSAASPLLNIQMGNEAQGAWIKLAPTLTGGITLTNFALLDGTTGTAGVGAATTTILDNGGANLSASINVDATAAGLVVGLTTLGSANGIDVRMVSTRLGTQDAAHAIGDVEIIGLKMAGSTISIAGH